MRKYTFAKTRTGRAYAFSSRLLGPSVPRTHNKICFRFGNSTPALEALLSGRRKTHTRPAARERRGERRTSPRPAVLLQGF